MYFASENFYGSAQDLTLTYDDGKPTPESLAPKYSSVEDFINSNFNSDGTSNSSTFIRPGIAKSSMKGDVKPHLILAGKLKATNGEFFDAEVDLLEHIRNSGGEFEFKIASKSTSKGKSSSLCFAYRKRQLTIM